MKNFKISMRLTLVAIAIAGLGCPHSSAAPRDLSDAAELTNPPALNPVLVRTPPPESYCALGLAILHSRSPRFGRHFERLAKMERDLPRLAVIAGFDDAGFQPCVDEMFRIVAEDQAKPRETGPKISIEAFDGGLKWGAGTRNLNPLDFDAGEYLSIELSGGMSGLAFVVDGGWSLCNDCKPPGWKPDDE